MARKIHLSIVGCGGIADTMAQLARFTPGVRLTAACDISLDRVEAFARKHNIPKATSDYGEMLAAGGFDAVYLAVPHNLHFEMIQAAADAGYHIFAEKPITRTLGEGREIVAYTAELGVKLGVNYQYRYDRGCYRMARAVQSGALGKVQYGRINLPWHRDPAYFDISPWHKTKTQAGGGTLITQASHLIDVFLWAVGSHPISIMGRTAQKVFAGIEVEDFAAGMVEFEGGISLQITSSMIAVPDQPVTIEVYGDRGTAIYTNHPWPRVKFFGCKPKFEGLPQWGFHALHRSLKGFRDWILLDMPYLIPGEAALAALQVVDALYKSAQLGHWVDVKE